MIIEFSKQSTGYTRTPQKYWLFPSEANHRLTDSRWVPRLDVGFDIFSPISNYSTAISKWGAYDTY